MEPQISQPAASQPSTKKPTNSLRALIINLLFSMFTALVIFTVASYYFLVPQIARQDLELRKLQSQITAMNERSAAPPESSTEDPGGEPKPGADGQEPGVGEAPSPVNPPAGQPADAPTGAVME